MNVKSKKNRKQVRKKVEPEDRKVGSYLIPVTPRINASGVKKEPFSIPYVSLKDGRLTAMNMRKQSNIQRGSLFIKPSYSVMGHSYNSATGAGFNY